MIEYIFSPDNVSSILENCTFIKERLRDPQREGKPSDAYPRARKSSREIYRILSYQHYPHLQELLGKLEDCLKAGYEQPTLLRTRSQVEFSSATSELYAAFHLQKLDFSVKGLDISKKEKTVPDIEASKGEVSCICEVYAPRDWDGMENYFDELQLLITNLDVPFDYIFTINMKIRNHFDEHGNLLRFDPWQFSDFFEKIASRTQEMEEVKKDILEDFERNNESEFQKFYQYEHLNVNMYIQFKRIERSAGDLPDRVGFTSLPTLTGYAPEGMFEQLVKRRIKAKMLKRQTKQGNGENIGVYFIDVSRLGYVYEFDIPVYLKMFARSVTNHIRLNVTSADIIIFFIPNNEMDTGIELYMVAKKNKIEKSMVQELIGKQTELVCYSEGIFLNAKIC
ncbi:MAG: hypothetical protein QQN41_09390 [Nitrosopumilus sp.]